MIFEGKHEALFEVLGPVSITAKNGGSISNRFCTGPSEKFAHKKVKKQTKSHKIANIVD